MRDDWNENVTLTMLDGEPTVVVWESTDVDEAMDAADDMGLPLALRATLAAELSDQRPGEPEEL